MAAAIVRLLKDAELRGRLGAAGRQRVVDEFSIEKMVRETLAIYESRRVTSDADDKHPAAGTASGPASS